MIFIDLIYNLSLLIALSIVSGFIDARWNRRTKAGRLLQGILFGGAALIGMLRPFVIEAGLIFDGRSVMISLCGLFFGFWPVLISCLMTAVLRIYQGGPGVYMGVLVICSSGALGILFHARRNESSEMTTPQLFLFGLLVHAAMLVMTLALPNDRILPTFQTIALPVMLIYPMATILIGKILSDQETKGRYVESLRQSEEKFRAIFNSSFHFSCLLTPGGHLIEANQTVLDATGVSAREVIGLPFWETVWWEGLGEEAVKLKEAIGVAAGGQFIRYEVILHGVSKTRILTDFSIKPCTNELGKVTVLIAEGRDITALKQADTERRSLELQLFQSQKLEAIGRLAGGVAHDFNNMLHAILGHVELVLHSLSPDSVLAKNIREIGKAASHSADLTRQLLAFARKQTIAPRLIDLNETVEGMLCLMKRLVREDIDLAWMPTRNLWRIKVDATQIHQVLTNLIVNARDAIEGVGRIVIETGMAGFERDFCATHPEFLPGEFVFLSISDTGCGMSKENLAKVFEPFYTTKEIGKGSGLGLATIYGIAKQNRGFINARSEVGKGSVFQVYLPRSYDAEDKVEGKPEPKKILPVAGKETVLLVEDEKALMEMGRIFLEKLGYRVLAADHPQEAIRLAREYEDKIDLLISDVIMPIMSGCDLMDEIVRQRPEIRTLFMSGYTSDIIVHQGVLRANVHFIQKPFSINSLAEKIREVFLHS